MNLSVRELRPKFVSIDYSDDGSKTSADISFDLYPTASTTLLEIGENHAFVHWSKHPFHAFFGRRRIRELSLQVERRSDPTRELPSGVSLSETKIGFVAFTPPEKSGKFRPDYPAYLTGRVFVSNELHESLRNLLQAGTIPTWLRLTLEIEEGGLGYGWEPDGSRIVWKVDNANKPCFLNVTEIRISLNGWRPLRNSILRLLAFVLGE